MKAEVTSGEPPLHGSSERSALTPAIGIAAARSAVRARRAYRSARSWDTQLFERRSVVAANVTVPLEFRDVGHHLRPPDVVEERAVNDSRRRITVHLFARDRPRGLCVAGGRASSSVVQPLLSRDAQRPVLVDPAVLLEWRAVGVSDVAAHPLVAPAARRRTAQKTVDALLDVCGSRSGVSFG